MEIKLNIWNEKTGGYNKEKLKVAKQELINFYNNDGFFKMPGNQVYVTIDNTKYLGYSPTCFVLILVNNKQEAEVHVYESLGALEAIIQNTDFDFEFYNILYIHNGWIEVFNKEISEVQIDNHIVTAESFIEFLFNPSQLWKNIIYFWIGDIDDQADPEVKITGIGGE